MAGMVMVMGSMFTLVIVVVYVGGSLVGMLVKMFVQVLMRMRMSMFMRVHLAVMRMLVRMCMSVLMRVQMLVLVLSFHGQSSFSLFIRLTEPFMSSISKKLTTAEKRVNETRGLTRTQKSSSSRHFS